MFRDITHAIRANALTPRKTQSPAILSARSARPFVKLHPGIVSAINESANEYARRPMELAAERTLNPEIGSSFPFSSYHASAR
jgi:hypothetical protein